MNRKQAAKYRKSYVVHENGCWVWTASKTTNGYGRFYIGSKAIRAHRLAWELNFGRVPKGKYVCHSCDNPLCINPDHLWIGTHEDNMRDMVSKSRHCFGDRHPKRIRTESPRPRTGLHLAKT